MAMKKTYYTVNGQIEGEATGGVRTEYLPDALGSVSATVDESGVVQNTYRYKPSGSQLSKTGAAADPRFGWVGQFGYRTTSTTRATHYVRRRTYDSWSAGWITVDLIWPFQRPYAYTQGNPVSRIDPSGFAARSSCCENDTHPCAEDPRGVCKYFEENGEVEIQPDVYGYPVCCNGKKYACLFNIPPGTDPGIIKCLEHHEWQHLNKTTCADCEFYIADEDLSRDHPIPLPVPEGGGECGAYAAEIACYMSRIIWSNWDKLEEYRKWICSACDQMKYHQCEKLPPICSWCKDNGRR